MKGSTENPKVFISYSWTSPQHEQWVLEFAERLSGDGVVVVLDKWDLKEGQDKHVFMEQMVNDKTVNKVLVVCDSVYQSKADNRKGGVGTETQLISKEIYENTGQEKFIPIIREHDTQGKPYIPHYMASRIYIDLSSDEIFEENYQKLVRNLYNKPLLKKPHLGTPPAYITEETATTLKTSHKVAEIRSALLNDRRSAGGLIQDYLDIFLSSLEEFQLQGGSADFDDRILESLEKMTPLRDDFIDFVSTIFKYQERVDLENLRTFLEKLLSFSFLHENSQSFTEVDSDNYRFFSYELVLYLIAVLIKQSKYDEAAFFINAPYFFRSRNSSELAHLGIEIFNRYLPSLDETRNKRLNLRRVSVTADQIKARANRKDINFNDLIQADLVIYYITELRTGGRPWFPRTSVFNSRGYGIEIFERLVSLQHFEKIKKLFNVKTVEELKKMIALYLERIQEQEQQGRRRSVSWDYEMHPLEKVLNPDKIGTVK